MCTCVFTSLNKIGADTLQDSIYAIFSLPRAIQFYNWLPTFETHVVRRFGVRDMLPVEGQYSVCEMSRRLIIRYMESIGKAIDEKQIAVYGFACYMICLKYHVDVADNTQCASIATKAGNGDFTKAQFLAAELEILKALNFKLD